MPHDPRKCLEDIRQAGSLILTATAGRTHEEYLNDLILRATKPGLAFNDVQLTLNAGGTKGSEIGRAS